MVGVAVHFTSGGLSLNLVSPQHVMWLWGHMSSFRALGGTTNIMSTLQDALLEILRQSPTFKSVRELQKALLDQTGRSSGTRSIYQSLMGLSRAGLVELRREYSYGGRNGCHCFWRVNDESRRTLP
jgi:hypothetical protein